MKELLKILLLPLLFFTLIGGSAYLSYKANIKKLEGEFENTFISETERQYSTFFHEIKSKIDIARSMQAFFQASESISRADFKIYADIVLKDRPEILALNWLPKITHAQRAEFEKEIRDEGFTSFKILDVTTGHKLIEAVESDIYYPIKYYEPYERNKKIHLLNAISAPQSLIAINRIINQNNYAFSQPFSLIQEPKKQQGILIYFPVYEDKYLTGMVEVVLRMGDILNLSLHKIELENNVLIELSDITGKTKFPIVKDDGFNEKNDLYQKRIFSLGTRLWKMAFSPSNKFMVNYSAQARKIFNHYIVLGSLINFCVSSLLVVLLIQIAKAKNDAREYKESQTRFETLLEKTGDAISLLDPGVRVIDCNQALVSMLGFESKDDLMKHPAEISPKFQPDGRLSAEKSKAMDEQCLLEGHNKFEWLHQKKDGSLFWVDVLLARLEYQGKMIIHVTARDITQYKEYEAKLKLSEARLNQAQEIAHLGSWQLKIRTNQLSCSNEFYKLFEIDAGTELTFSDVLYLTHPEDREVLRQTYQLSIRTKTSYTLDHRLLLKNNKIKFIRAWGVTEYDEVEKTLISFGSMMDISKQKIHEEELLKARLEADQANQKKSEFLANISHELRTPMHGILGFSNFGIKKIDSASKEVLKKYFTNIQISGNRLLVLINDLLDLSKIEADKMILDKQQADLRGVFDLCCLEQEQRIKDLNLTVQINQTTSNLLGVFDSTKICQVITNFLSNAMKFSPESGVIAVTISKTANEELSFCIQDQGIGIPEAELELIFDVFVQSSSTKTGSGGTGLGLAICQQIITAHGGSVWAENNVKNGAKFIFIIPCEISKRL